MRKLLELVAAVSGNYPLVYETTLHFVGTKHWYKISGEMLHSIEISILQHCQWRHESWGNDVR